MNVLIVSPHPDDESIGCGGTLRRHAADGDAVHAVFLTSGEKCQRDCVPAEMIAAREAEARRAADVLGLASVEFWREPDGGVTPHEAVVARLAEVLVRLRPGVCYVTSDHEAHADHAAAAEILRRARRRLPAGQPQPVVFMFEVWSPLERIDHIVDITGTAPDKRAAIRAHESQCRIQPFDAAALALNQYRGKMHHWPPVEYAEAFLKMPPEPA